ncbi:MAG TPA: M12 family metallo-peptidase [Pseudomonas sp.]|uniref:reprolysin-like metallopeptidase n=1 Tax=Pseudomonas sp. TaxID=306 RepID=UPI002ED98593
MSLSKKPVNLYLFYHDDVDAATRRIVPKNYLKDCIQELQKVTGREFSIHYMRSIPGMTDMNYKGYEAQVIADWDKQVRRYVEQHRLSLEKTDKYLLVTNDQLNENTVGVAYQGKNSLVASLVTYQAIAHEIGHSLGAVHEDSELQHNAFGGVCETFVYPNRDTGRGNCYSYSVKNRQRMADFLSTEP